MYLMKVVNIVIISKLQTVRIFSMFLNIVLPKSFIQFAVFIYFCCLQLKAAMCKFYGILLVSFIVLNTALHSLA